MCSLRPAPFSYLCVHARILCVLKSCLLLSNKACLSPYACCGLHFYWLRCLCPVLLPLHFITTKYNTCIINAAHCNWEGVTIIYWAKPLTLRLLWFQWIHIKQKAMLNEKTTTKDTLLDTEHTAVSLKSVLQINLSVLIPTVQKHLLKAGGRVWDRGWAGWCVCVCVCMCASLCIHV